MEAWGVGMLENDVAQNAIDNKANKIAAIIRNKDKKSLKNLLKNLEPQAILGVVEYVFNSGMPHTFFDTCRAIIDKAIDHEKNQSELETWGERLQLRKQELIAFKKRLQGKSIVESR